MSLTSSEHARCCACSPSPAVSRWAPQHAGSSLRDQRSLQGNPTGGPDAGSTSCSSPWCGAGLQAPGRGLRPRDRGQEPPSADPLRSPLPRCGSYPRSPLGFPLIHGNQKHREMRSALRLVGAGWDPECRQTLPPTGREPEVSHSGGTVVGRGSCGHEGGPPRWASHEAVTLAGPDVKQGGPH